MARRAESSLNGYVTQLKSGRWAAYFPRRVDPRRRTISPGKSFDTEEQAREALRVLVSRFDAGLLVIQDSAAVVDEDGTRRDVRNMVRRFIEVNEGTLSVSTLRGYRSDNNWNICDPNIGIGSVLVADLTREQVQQWKLNLERRGASQHTVRASFALLRSVLQAEVEAGRLRSNPAMGFTVRRTKKRTAERKSVVAVPVLPTFSQQRTLVSAMTEPGDRLFLLTLIWSGARFTELASVPPKHLTVGAGLRLQYVWVCKEKGVWVREPLKSGTERTVILPTRLAEKLHEYSLSLPKARNLPEGRKDLLLPFVPLDGKDVRGGAGVRTSRNFLDHGFSKARIEAGVPTLKAKDLRANAGSLMVDAGMTMQSVQIQLGHTVGSSITLRSYVRPLDDEFNPKREEIRLNPELSVQGRLDALFDLWADVAGFDPFSYPGR